MLLTLAQKQALVARRHSRDKHRLYFALKMGALAPLSPWLPEDDLLLKNSVENGASLESLAKGAVQFSRKFSVRELQDRWHSLLYDPVVSAEASFRMIEYERCAPPFPSKFTRAGNSKEKKIISGKRKAESVRSCYFALRKRIHNEPFNSMDLSYFAPSNGNFFGNGDEPLSGNFMLGDSMANHFGLQNSNLDVMHQTFPDIPMDGDAACRDDHTLHSFHGTLDHHFEEDFSMPLGDVCEGVPHIFEENQSFTGNGAGVEEVDQLGQVPNLFEADHAEVNPPCTYGQINSEPGNVCTFEGNQVFHSPIPESGAPFQNLELSPLPEMPIWRTVEDISSPTIPVDDSLREKNLHSGDTFALPDDGDAKDTSIPGCDFVHANSKLKTQMSCDESKNEAPNTDGYLEELSNSLWNSTNDEELLFMDADAKEMIDKSYYDGLSLLLNSPNEAKRDHMPSQEPETSVTPDCLANTSAACPAESVGKVQMPSSASVSDPQFPEQNDGIMVCILSTEDTEIPCNDDLFLPNKLQPLSTSVAKQQNFKEAGNPFSSSAKDFSGNRKINDPVLMQGGSTHMVGSQVIPEKRQLHPVGDSGVKFELGNCESSQLVDGTPCGGSIKNNSMNTSKDSLQSARLKEENKEIGRTLTDSSLEKPDFGANCYKYHERNINGFKQELDDPATTHESQAFNAEVGSMHIPDSEVVNPTTSEPEEPSVESEDDGVPYFSDIEAMILDMDLDPEDEDLCEQEVSKYQHEDTRRAIIRLEQGAHSYMQREIASIGAFAMLYGRNSKHYIKKPEVLLGRATEDVVVDIDLGREGRANKISRRQAIINMDGAGSFHVKNLGKFPILVNNKEVPSGRSLSLNSSCLIEIRGLPFIFEANQTCVKRYLDSIRKKKPNSCAACLNYGRNAMN